MSFSAVNEKRVDFLIIFKSAVALVLQHVEQCVAVCCSALQCVAEYYKGSIPRIQHTSAVCCSVLSGLRCVEGCCRVLLCVLQCVAVCCGVLQWVAVCRRELQGVAGCCSVLRYVAVCYHGSFPYIRARCWAPSAVYCSALQCVAVSCGVLQCVAVRCSALQ